MSTALERVIREPETAEAYEVWGPLTDAGAHLAGTRFSDRGEYVLRARGAEVRTDARGSGGPEIYAGELLLGALTSCALAAVEGAAGDAGVVLRDLRVDARSERSDATPPRYAWLSLDFALEGVDQRTAEDLVSVFLETCPIYGTLAAVSPVAVRVAAIG